jgi:guanosine-3',5'-bis(diphosphate) 3'-pyrophosphohydrolase
MSSPSLPLWQRAASFAARAHRNQTRKDGGTPYFAHPVRVALTVRDVFGCDDPVCLAAALLHDTIEDTTTDSDDLAEQFGHEVADIVAAVTKNGALPEVQREASYDSGLARADWRARLIKLADVYDNFCDAVEHHGRGRVPQKNFEKAARAMKLAREGEKDAGGCVERAVGLVGVLVGDAGR